MEQIWINGVLRTVPAALFSRPEPRAAIAEWAKDPDGVEATLAAEAKAAGDAVARAKPIDRLRREAAERDAGVRADSKPGRGSRATRGTAPSTDAQE